MDLSAHFRRLFSYDVWANREVIRAMRVAGSVPPKSLKLLAHISAAERLWWDRLMLRPQSVPVWPDWTVQECESRTDDPLQRVPRGAIRQVLGDAPYRGSCTGKAAVLAARR